MGGHRAVSRHLVVAGAVLCAAAALIAVARLRAGGPAQAEVRAAVQALAAYRAAAQTARNAAPPDGGCESLAPMLELRIGSPMLRLLEACIEDPRHIAPERWQAILEAGPEAVSGRGPFAHRIPLAGRSPQQALEDAIAWLRPLPPLRAIEDALRGGACDGAFLRLPNPRSFNAVTLSILFAARASAEAAAGDPAAAIETCLSSLRLSDRLDEWPDVYAYVEQYHVERMTAKAIARALHAGPVPSAAIDALRAAYARRQDPAPLERALVFHAAIAEAGLEARERGLGAVGEAAFSLRGHGAWARAQSLRALIGRPAHAARAELHAIAHDGAAAYLQAGFIDEAVQAYKYRARVALRAALIDAILALEAFRTRHGRYPASFAEAGLPEAPPDPLSGLPLDYAPGPGGYAIIGPPGPDIWPEDYWTVR